MCIKIQDLFLYDLILLQEFIQNVSGAKSIHRNLVVIAVQNNIEKMELNWKL